MSSERNLRRGAMLDAIQHIEEIRTKKFSIGKEVPNPLTLDLHHAVSSLSAELYQKDIHFLMELIQNAEDNEYKQGVEPTLEFVLTKKDITGTGAPATLLVFNNEVGFSKENIDSICSVGRSTKKGKRRQGFIGEKGIGFKSVFLVSAQPHIFSNAYHVRFREEPNQVCGIGYIVPEWVSAAGHLSVSTIQAVYGHDKGLPTTTFILPLKPDKVEAVRAQLLELHPEILLFLSKLKRLYVRGCDPQKVDDVSTLSIFSETEHTELSSKTANSCVVQLSVKEKKCDTEQMCKYYLWREEFLVKPRNRVDIRMDVEKWVITLAFPFGERLRRGTSSVGIFAFLPTTMITNFPFIIQADFILASSRESIILDNAWNMGILQCVPSAFVNAFQHCVGQLSLFSSVGQPFEFLPAQDSPTSEFNKVRESIRTRLQGLNIVPCKRFSGESLSSKLPQLVVRIKPKFRDLIVKFKRGGAVLSGSSSSSLKRVLDSSLDVEKYKTIMDFLGVAFADDDWYTACINSCNLLLLSDEVYIELLGFLADNETEFDSDSIENVPLLKYTDRKGSFALCTISKTTEEELKVRYAMDLELHTWLSKCNMKFGCPDNVYFLPNSTLEAVLNHQKGHLPRRRCRKKKTHHMESSSFCNWPSSVAGVISFSAYDYTFLLLNHVSKKESNVAVRLANFLFHAHKKGFLTDYEISDLCGRIPVVDGTDQVRMQRTLTLVPSSGSKWAKLFGHQNPFAKQHYVDIGNVYAKSSLFVGISTPEKELLHFVGKYSKAVDLPELCPPDVALEITSDELSSEQAFLLLDWIRLLRTKNSSIPKKFIESIENGKWMKTLSGYKSPREAILLDETGKVIFDMMKHVLEDVSILDQEFYMNQITLYQDELKFLGVRLGYEDMGRLVTNRFTSLASSGMSKECTFSLLTFINFSRGRSMVNDWLVVMKEKKWLKTLQGYNPSKGSILLLQSEIEAETCSKVTNLPIVDEAFYGSRLGSFLSELRLLGVAYDTEVVQKLIAENVNLTSNLSSMTGGCGLLILKCIRWLGSGAAGLIKRIKCQPWVKTTLGFKCPSETVLPDPNWGSLLGTLQVPAIDELYYDNAIRQFVDELNALGVVVDTIGTSEMIAAQFKSLLSSSSLAPANVMSLLRCIREMNQTMSLQDTGLQWLLSEKWMKTRHGFKTPDESIIFSSKWGQLMLFVDLPLIDDVYYGTGIYKFRDELEKLGAITDFERGAPFVAKGLHSPIEAELLDADGIKSLLECIRSLMSQSLDDPLVGDFLKNIANSRCMKITNGYKAPKDCILFDASWESILNKSDAPSIDEAFYGTDISAYKNQLRDIGVKVDPQDVCSLLSGLLLSLTDTGVITRIYSFLNKFKWSPKGLDKCNSQVWIPGPKGTGVWVKSQCCVLHERNHLFGSHLFSLDKSYSKELLPIFSSAFGVPENPSMKDYLQLWDSWASVGNSKVTVEKCSSFWKYIVDNWNPQVEESLKQDLTKVPATMSMSGEICLIRKEEAFIADDLQLKTIFSSFDKAPLFVWFPYSSSYIPHRRLLQIYESLGIRKISASVVCNVKGILSSEHWKKVEQKNGFIGRSLTKIIMAFLAGPQVNMPRKERLKAAKSIGVLTVYKVDKPIEVCYRLMPCASTTVEVEKLKLVLWEKDSKRLFIDKSGFDGGKGDLEFVTSFADELAQGLLAQARPSVSHSLSKIIQMGYIYDFKENEVDYLLMTENLELFVEDKEFLDTEFNSAGESARESALVSRKRTSKKPEQLGPSTPMPSCKKQRK